MISLCLATQYGFSIRASNSIGREKTSISLVVILPSNKLGSEVILSYPVTATSMNTISGMLKL